MKNAQSVLLLVEELCNDYGYIQEASLLRSRAESRVQASSWNDELDLMVLGSCLHNVYNAVEAYFLRVAKFFENSVDDQ